ncbi:16S rRNA (guanine(966)-N(2))-methyltransferase RsmD [Pendulispora albinea]|uniref:16S rRNA (Guanine(966)-N(2))-methyltransferase RsmD n=1 Tax=Pendulispora albinea TaxID=2741071 RepID=A0ABZ2LYW3_9BACT
MRSRPLRAPKGDRTRPTSDRVREALFSILVARIGRTDDGELPFSGDRVLDLYAGTGSLGLEALSRGAAHATFVEEGRDALVALRGNIVELGVAKTTTVLAMSVERATRTRTLGRISKEEQLTLVFADPPYKLVKGGELARALGPIVESDALAPDATVVIEHASGDAAPDVSGLSLEESRRYGDTTVSLYLYRSRNRHVVSP